MTVVVTYIGDGSTPISAARCKSIARAIPAHDVFVYGGDVYDSGTTAEYTGTNGFNDIYGDNALNVTPQGQNLIAKAAHTAANHEYRTVNATTLKVDTYDAYWAGGTPARNASNYVAVDNTKTDPNAAYPGMTSADAQKRAAAQWAHLRSVDIQGWRLLFIDMALSGTDQGSFPTAGNYKAAVQALIDGAAHRKLIVFAHMARWSSGITHTDAQQVNIDPLWQMVAPKALAWVAGHNHHFERQFARTADGSVASVQSRGCVPITAGTGGTGLSGFVATYATAAALAYRDATKFGFVKLTLNPNSATIVWNAMGTDGLGTPTVEDTVTLNSVPAPQNISVTNATVGGGVVNWSATKTQTWTSLVPASGTSPGTIAVHVDPAGLAPGTYTDTVTVISPETTNDPLTVSVQLVVSSATAPATLALAASSPASSGSLALATPAPLALASGALTSSGTLTLTAPTQTTPAQLALAASSPSASGSLALTAPSSLALAAAAPTASGTLALTARTSIPLAAAPASASGSLAVTAPTTLPLAASSPSASGALALTAPTQIALAASSPSASGSLTVTVPGVANLPLAAASPSSSGSLALTAPTRIALATAAASASGALSLTAATRIPLAPGGPSSSGSLAVTVPGSANLALAAGAASSSGSLALTAPTRIGLAAASVAASGSLALTTGAPPAAVLSLAPAFASASGSLGLTTPTRIPLTPTTPLAGGSLALATPIFLALTGASILGGGSLALSVLVPGFSGPGYLSPHSSGTIVRVQPGHFTPYR